MFKKILIATDGSSRAEKAAAYAVDMAKDCDAELNVVSVVDTDKPRNAGEIDSEFYEEIEDSPNIDIEELEEKRKKPETQFANRVVEQATEKGVNAAVTVRVGNPAEEIVNAARESGSEVIVIGSHGRSALGAALVGSVTTSVIHGGDLPVLVIPVHDTQD